MGVILTTSDIRRVTLMLAAVTVSRPCDVAPSAPTTRRPSLVSTGARGLSMRWNLCLLSASVIVALSAGSVLGWQETIAPVDPEIATAPVRIDGEELFRVRGV